MKSKTIFLAVLLLLCRDGSLKNLRLDSDNDGVADIYDKCKNTPFLDLVDSTGCSIAYKETKK